MFLDRVRLVDESERELKYCMGLSGVSTSKGGRMDRKRMMAVKGDRRRGAVDSKPSELIPPITASRAPKTDALTQYNVSIQSI